jgi:hypothetical protein
VRIEIGRVTRMYELPPGTCQRTIARALRIIATGV